MKFLAAFLVTATTLLAAEPVRLLETSDAWTFADPGAWAWTKDDGRAVLTLHPNRLSNQPSAARSTSRGSRPPTGNPSR